MRWRVLTMLLMVGCESSALDPAAPAALDLAPVFMQTETQEIEVRFEGYDTDNADGERTTWQVTSWDFGDEGPEVQAWEFETNFRLRLEVRRLGATQGEHPFTLTIRNHFGTYTARAEFFVF